eukprot:TRINITY_DN1342_c0_g1_i5.p1 TRINITY_DN1342_c0_g1~~TRINITY_DN1342_c0_g1_i5.p1  ORF type:complete len:541 (-),score=151.71 TRINITY_DN1342_c0_g1_i5:1688-3310(-)
MKQDDEDDVEKLEKDDEIPLKQGFLTKKVPQKHSWKPAWFVLKPRSLCVYANAWAIKPRAVFRVGHHLKVELQSGEYVEPNREVKTCFKISSAKKELLVLAQTMDELQSWMQAILNAKKMRSFYRQSLKTSTVTADLIRELYEQNHDVSKSTSSLPTIAVEGNSDIKPVSRAYTSINRQRSLVIVLSSSCSSVTTSPSETTTTTTLEVGTSDKSTRSTTESTPLINAEKSTETNSSAATTTQQPSSVLTSTSLPSSASNTAATESMQATTTASSSSTTSVSMPSISEPDHPLASETPSNPNLAESSTSLTSELIEARVSETTVLASSETSSDSTPAMDIPSSSRNEVGAPLVVVAATKDAGTPIASSPSPDAAAEKTTAAAPTTSNDETESLSVTASSPNPSLVSTTSVAYGKQEDNDDDDDEDDDRDLDEDEDEDDDDDSADKPNPNDKNAISSPEGITLHLPPAQAVEAVNEKPFNTYESETDETDFTFSEDVSLRIADNPLPITKPSPTDSPSAPRNTRPVPLGSPTYNLLFFFKLD